MNDDFRDRVRRIANPTSVDLGAFEDHIRPVNCGRGTGVSGLALWVSPKHSSSSTLHIGADIQDTLAPVISTGFVMFKTSSQLPSYLLVQSTRGNDPRAYPIRTASRTRRSRRPSQRLVTLHVTMPIQVLEKLRLPHGRISIPTAAWYVEGNFLAIDFALCQSSSREAAE